MNPIIPHSTEYVWKKVLNYEDLIYNSDFSSLLINKWISEIKNTGQIITTNIIEDWGNLMELIKNVQSAIVKNSKKKNWNCKKIILKFNLKEISHIFVQNLFSKVLGYPIEISNLDRPRPYFIFDELN
jgi:isoleucyl-tRNA synthetase